MKLLISRRAEDDLVYIYAVIARARPDRAEAFEECVDKSFRLLAEYPEIGRAVTFRTRNKRLRFWPVPEFRNYVIYYLAQSDHVSVERVLDGRRDVQRIFRTREF